MKEITPDIKKTLEKMREFKAYTHLRKKEREELISCSRFLEFDDQEVIIHEGDTSNQIYTIIEGAVNIMVEQSDKEVFISSIGQGDVIGEAAIFINKKRTASAQANGSVLLMEMDRDSFIQFIKRNPSAGIKLLIIIIYSLLNKLRDANQELAFERKASFNQDQIDNLLTTYFQE